MAAGATWRSWYLLGSDTGIPARYNRMFPHIQRLSSYLYSPVDVQFSVEVDKSQSEKWKQELSIASSSLSRDFHRRAADLAFGEALDWALVKGATFVKLNWGHNGVDPWVVQPEMMGVLREDIADLNAQEAFFHSTYLTPSMVRRMLYGKSNAEKIMKRVKADAKKSADDPARDDMFKQVIIGGVNPVATTTPANQAGGIVQWMSGGNIDISPHVVQSLIRLDELWVIDDDKQDYTTIQLLGDKVVLCGEDQHINLCGIEGTHPFVRVCANPMYGNIWGRSEFANLWPIQDAINQRLQGIEDVWRLQEDAPKGLIGFQGITDEMKLSARKPGGWLVEPTPGAKIEDLAPKLPEGAFQELHDLFAMFDDIGGMTPTLTGHGEQGVRAQAHAETLVRTSSPQVRDRALLVERQLEDLGDLQLKMIQAHDATAFELPPEKKGGIAAMFGGAQSKTFVLSQLPEDTHVSVDSHSGSPAFSEESARLAFALNQRGAISAADLIGLTSVQHKDRLMAAAQQREEAQAELVRQHPELLSKGGKGR